MKLARWPALIIAMLFALIGLAFVPLAGIHVDAASELACFYSCGHAESGVEIHGRQVPLMAMSYLGAFKAWLYQPILHLRRVTPLSIRLPALLAGAGTVWMLFALLDKAAGRRAAIAGALLLATDASFLLSTAYDFGPIAFLHLFFMAGVLLLLRFEKTGTAAYLAFAFLLFGLALWHKALFIWMLAGLTVAAVAVFPKRVLATLTLKNVAIAAIAFGLGAWPLIAYNVRTKGATFRTAEVMAEDSSLSEKLEALRRTADGSEMFGFLTEEAGQKSNWMFVAMGLSFCMLPWLWFTPLRRASMFAATYMATAWLLMAATPKAGASIHHVILLWPLPHFLIACAGEQIARRFGAPGARAILACLLGVLTVNSLLLYRYYSDLVTTGTSVVWTDAIYPLYNYLKTQTGARLIAVDWGYAGTLCLLSKGEMPLDDISYSLVQSSGGDSDDISSMIANATSRFVGHVESGEQFRGAEQRLAAIAKGAGYSKEVLKVITDRNNRPRFTVSRYVSPTAGLSSVILTANPAHARQLAGFHRIENDSWRWTRKIFSATLGWPDGGNPELVMELYVPPMVIQRLGPIVLNALTGSRSLGAEVYTAPGNHRYARAVALPANRSADPFLVEFRLDKAFAPGQVDQRELGIIVRSIGLYAR